ncbi:MAG: aminopeptidase P N-terminal domain-containing protein [Rhodoferax sp.]
MANIPPPSPSTPQALRRAAVARAIGAEAIALIPTAPECVRNRDNHHPFRPDSYFWYLTGFREPNAWLAIEGSGRSTLLCQPQNLEREIWDGYRLGVDAAPAALGVDAALSVADIDTALARLLDGKRSVWFPFGVHPTLQAQVEGWLSSVRSRSRQGARCPTEQHDLCAVLDDMRLTKDASELATMRAAAAISAGAHVRAMQKCAQWLRAGREVREYHLDAELNHSFRRVGAQGVAYESIVAAGANACVLHYRADSAPVRNGELVLIDAGCELDGYASDITRTFPANGRFSAPQRDLYQLVLAAQHAAVACIRPGARFNDAHEAAVRVLTQGLLDLRLLDANMVGNLDDAIERKAYNAFYMHRTGHWLGLDVHDCGGYDEPSEIDQARERTDPLTGATLVQRPSRILRPGMVVTVEPGLYVRPAPGVPEAFHHMGIRIEDDAVLTPGGCELITRGVPVEVGEIEALMAP